MLKLSKLTTLKGEKPQWSPDRRKVLYERPLSMNRRTEEGYVLARDMGYGVYDLHELVRDTILVTDSEDFQWLPHGSKLSYIEKNSLYVVDSSELSNKDYRASVYKLAVGEGDDVSFCGHVWIDDNSLLIRSNKGLSLCRIKADDPQIHKTHLVSLGGESSFALSPDRSSVAYHKLAKNGKLSSEIVEQSLTRGAPQTLFHYRAATCPRIAYSPDGAKVAFLLCDVSSMAESFVDQTYHNGGPRTEVFVYDRRKDFARKIASIINAYDVDFSPDSRFLAVSSYRKYSYRSADGSDFRLPMEQLIPEIIEAIGLDKGLLENDRIRVLNVEDGSEADSFSGHALCVYTAGK